jgi:starch synthase
MQSLIDHSDAIVAGSENLTADLTKYIETSKKPFLPFAPKENYKEIYINFVKEKVLE